MIGVSTSTSIVYFIVHYITLHLKCVRLLVTYFCRLYILSVSPRGLYANFVQFITFLLFDYTKACKNGAVYYIECTDTPLSFTQLNCVYKDYVSMFSLVFYLTFKMVIENKFGNEKKKNIYGFSDKCGISH